MFEINSRLMAISYKLSDYEQESRELSRIAREAVQRVSDLRTELQELRVILNKKGLEDVFTTERT